MESLSLTQTHELLNILESDNVAELLEEFVLTHGYDESTQDDFIYATEVITYRHRKISGVK